MSSVITIQDSKVYTKYPIEEMSKVFDEVCNKDDWKGEIVCPFISFDKMDIVKESIIFYTATEPEFIPVYGYPHPNALVKVIVGYAVYAKGYRLGPAGDH